MHGFVDFILWLVEDPSRDPVMVIFLCVMALLITCLSCITVITQIMIRREERGLRHVRR